MTSPRTSEANRRQKASDEGVAYLRDPDKSAVRLKPDSQAVYIKWLTPSAFELSRWRDGRCGMGVPWALLAV